jgi:glycosyltransferase involved in cell wall biosynthesis
VTPAVGKGPQSETDDCELTPDDSAVQRGAVYFYGFRQIEENPVFYALAEAFVLPSLKEEWGLVVNEAMAAGLPVIVSRTAGCAEDLVPGSESWQCSVGSIQSGENAGSLNAQPSSINSLEERSNGFVFDPKSSDALCEALRRIADQETKRLKGQETNGLTEMGRRSREIVERSSCENFARQALRATEAAGARATIRK